MSYFVHESSYVDVGTSIGEGTSIWHFCHVFKGARIGKNCKIGQNVVIHSTAVLYDHVKVQNNVSIYDGVTLEDFVFCGPSCVFTNIINPRSEVPRNTSDHYKKILVQRGASIGANATIVCGVTIGEYAFIGAGSVVTKDVKPHELVYGSPATHKGWMCACGVKLSFVQDKAVCTECSTKFNIIDNRVTKE
ncbi:MAG: N-acetyltransferase [Candidatus Omnitrophica bacterium]|nr:N-acetyltransferase [Candidatus Omnitrophota bacterium]